MVGNLKILKCYEISRACFKLRLCNNDKLTWTSKLRSRQACDNVRATPTNRIDNQQLICLYMPLLQNLTCKAHFLASIM